MNQDQWSMLFKPYRTRAEIRKVLLGEMESLVRSTQGRAALPSEIDQLPIGSDREVMESFDKLQKFCNGLKGDKRSSIAGAISIELCDLFSKALERMNALPPEHKAPAIAAAWR